MRNQPIKSSAYNVSDKEVVKWTQVVIGRNFPHIIQGQKFQYTRGELLERRRYPPEVKHL